MFSSKYRIIYLGFYSIPELLIKCDFLYTILFYLCIMALISDFRKEHFKGEYHTCKNNKFLIHNSYILTYHFP